MPEEPTVNVSLTKPELELIQFLLANRHDIPSYMYVANTTNLASSTSVRLKIGDAAERLK